MIYQKFINNPATPLPPMIQFYVGTSSTGTAEQNAAVAAARMKFLTDLYLGIMKELSISPDIAYKLMAEAPEVKKDMKGTMEKIILLLGRLLSSRKESNIFMCFIKKEEEQASPIKESG